MTSRMEELDYRRRVFRLYAEVQSLHDADPHSAHAHWRAVRDQLFGSHPHSALLPDARAAFRGLRYYDYDPAFAVTVSVDTDLEVERFDVATSTGQTVPLERFGRVALPWGSLDVYWLDVHGGGIFIPFRDETGGDATHDGGRYLYDTASGADLGSTPSGQLVLDFNFAYHPPCDYNPARSCPLVPPGSRIDARIEAGEQRYVRTR